MTVSQNGFPVLVSPTPALSTFRVGGEPFVVATEILPAAVELCGLLNALEPVGLPGWDGGYSYRKIAGSAAWSNHASGTAIDWNASRHPRGAHLPDGWTAEAIRVLRWYLRTKRGAVWRWGADFHTTPDAMHFEIVSLDAWKSAANPWKH